MTGEVKTLQFAEGTNVTSAPTEFFLTGTSFRVYANDAAYVTAKGSAAANGDIYKNSTDGYIHFYDTAWRVVDSRKINATTADPTVNDDNTAGYEVNSKWINTTSGKYFIAKSVGTGAASWIEIIDKASTQTLTGAKTFDLEQTIKNISTPSNPSSGYLKVYSKSDALYTLTSGGVESQLALSTGAFNSSAYLSSTDFPNTTTLYGWRANTSAGTFTTVYGGIDLTENGTLATGNDHLATSTYCAFDGTNDYLSSTDAAFNFTGTFSVGLWFYKSSWTSGSGTLVSRHNGTNGWIISCGNSTVALQINSVTNNLTNGSFYINNVADGWHHIALIRNTTGTSKTSLYFDGKKVFENNVIFTTITAAGNLEVGSTNGGSSKFTGRITELWIHKDTAWTTNEVKKIYATGSKLYIGVNGNTVYNFKSPADDYTFSYTPTWYKSDETTTFTPNNYGDVIYSICGTSIQYQISMVHSTGSLGNSSGAIWVTAPMVPDFDLNSHSGTGTGSISTLQEGSAKMILIDPATTSKLRISYFTYAGASSSFTNAASRTDCWAISSFTFRP